jgi:hypothetical protein
MNTPQQYRINDSRVFGFYIVEQRNELNWEAISKPMGRMAATSALEQLNNRRSRSAPAVKNNSPQVASRYV